MGSHSTTRFVRAAHSGHPLEFEDPRRERRAVRIPEYRDGHISRADEWDDYIEWFMNRGERARRAIEAFEAKR